MTSTEQAQIKRCHQQAMGHCDRAVAARARRDHEQAKASFRRAFALERKAADLIANEEGLEPTRSVLHRSAASLALECGEHREAEKLIGRALAGNPPEEIAEELRDLLEQVNLSRHLALKGVVLLQDEFQLSIEGKAVGHGMAESTEFVDRVQTSEKLVVRTFERKSGRPFRETGRAIRDITQHAELYLSAPRAASFAVTLRIGLPQKQMGLPGMEREIVDQPAKIIDELFDCLDTFQRKDNERLRELIPNETYRRNFIALAQRLVPDGDRVKLVGLTVTREGKPRQVALVKQHPDRQGRKKTSKEAVTITGRLLFANSTKQRRKTIKIVDDDGNDHTLLVPEGMMADIVKPLWEDKVVVRGVKRGKVVRLQHIDRAPDVPEE
jgi:hypothetical protein